MRDFSCDHPVQLDLRRKVVFSGKREWSPCPPKVNINIQPFELICGNPMQSKCPWVGSEESSLRGWHSPWRPWRYVSLLSCPPASKASQEARGLAKEPMEVWESLGLATCGDKWEDFSWFECRTWSKRSPVRKAQGMKKFTSRLAERPQDSAVSCGTAECLQVFDSSDWNHIFSPHFSIASPAVPEKKPAVMAAIIPAAPPPSLATMIFALQWSHCGIFQSWSALFFFRLEKWASSNTMLPLWEPKKEDI